MYKTCDLCGVCFMGGGEFSFPFRTTESNKNRNKIRKTINRTRNTQFFLCVVSIFVWIAPYTDRLSKTFNKRWIKNIFFDICMKMKGIGKTWKWKLNRNRFEWFSYFFEMCFETVLNKWVRTSGVHCIASTHWYICEHQHTHNEIIKKKRHYKACVCVCVYACW